MAKQNSIKINVIKLTSLVIRDKIMTGVFILVFAVISTIIAINKPKVFTASAKLAPEGSTKGSISDVANLASMIGMNMQFGDINDAIYPEIYPDLMKSNEFVVGLFDIPVKSQDGKIKTTYSDYLANYQYVPFWSKWIGNVMNLFKSKAIASGKVTDKVNPFMLTKNQQDIVDAINGSITCNVDQKTSMISIEVQAQDPLIAASITDSVKNRLQVFITNYRTQKARNDLKYAYKLYGEAKSQYVKARQLYSTYSDMNEDLVLQSYKSKTEDLENDMQLKYNIYTQVVQQVQLAQAKVQENTPAFTIVQGASVPLIPNPGHKLFTVLFGMFLGFFLRIIILSIEHRKEIIVLPKE